MSIQEHKKSYKISNSHRLPNDMLRIILDYAIQRKEHVLPLSLISKRWNELVKDVVKTRKRVFELGDYLFEIFAKDDTKFLELESKYFGRSIRIFVTKGGLLLNDEVQVKVGIELNPNDYTEEGINGEESLGSKLYSLRSMFDNSWTDTRTIADMVIPHFDPIGEIAMWSTISRLKTIINRLILAVNPPNFEGVTTINIDIKQDITATHWMAIDKWHKKRKGIFKPYFFFCSMEKSKLEEMLKDPEIQQLLYWNSE